MSHNDEIEKKVKDLIPNAVCSFVADKWDRGYILRIHTEKVDEATKQNVRIVVEKHRMINISYFIEFDETSIS
jgi:hypothetical protein